MDSTKTCAVLACEFNVKSNNKPQHYFDFPKDEEMFNKWCTAIRRLDLLQKNNNLEESYVCINHFSSDSYHFDNGYKLHEGAVPKLVKYQKTLVNKIFIDFFLIFIVL